MLKVRTISSTFPERDKCYSALSTGIKIFRPDILCTVLQGTNKGLDFRSPLK